jgi:hypothetical protein
VGDTPFPHGRTPANSTRVLTRGGRGQGEVLSWVETGGFMYWEVSAKTGYKVQELLDKVEHAVLTGENPGVVGLLARATNGGYDVDDVHDDVVNQAAGGAGSPCLLVEGERVLVLPVVTKVLSPVTLLTWLCRRARAHTCQAQSVLYRRHTSQVVSLILLS